ncbi:MAG: restriction endonuclease subunit S, partial [bacterium]
MNPTILESRTVGDILKRLPRQHKIKRSDYKDKGIIPVIDQGEGFIGGYIDDPSLAYNGPLPVVLFGDHTRILKYLQFKFAIGADGTQLLRPNEDFDVQYFYYSLRALNLKNYGYERHFKYLKDEKIMWRPMPEQKTIVTILSAYDDLIGNKNRRIQILEEMARKFYREWFVHFHFPGHEEVKFVTSPLGPIPEGWEPILFEALLVSMTGGDWGAEQPTDD